MSGSREGSRITTLSSPPSTSTRPPCRTQTSPSTSDTSTILVSPLVYSYINADVSPVPATKVASGTSFWVRCDATITIAPPDRLTVSRYPEFDFRVVGDGRSATARYANNSNYRNDSLIRKESTTPTFAPRRRPPHSRPRLRLRRYLADMMDGSVCQLPGSRRDQADREGKRNHEVRPAGVRPRSGEFGG